MLSQLLIASTNPQEVLDAGNWLIANEGLKGKELDAAAAQIGFTPPVRALVQFPQTIDMMCMEMGWTTELGQAFVADQAGVLDAIQRLRRQAMDVGNLKSSDAMLVETTEQEGKEVVVLKPAQPEVVYVPTYDPQAAYVPPPATTTTTAATTTEDKGHSTGSMIATGVLAFGAGILVSEIFDDDDDDYYYPNYGYGGMPYYPPYPYRPTYGGGYYPSNGYNRPPNYNNGWQNNGTIVINNPGGGGGGGYWDRYDNNRAGATSTAYRKPNSPITTAKPNRSDLNTLNQRQPRPMPANVKPPSATATAANWKGQSTYAGKAKRPAGAATDPATRIAEANPGYSRAPASGNAKGPAPKVQGSYAGMDKARPAPSTQRPASGSKDLQKPKPSTRDVQRPSGGGSADRGYGSAPATRDVNKPTSKPQTMPGSRAPSTGSGSRDTAMSGANRGSADRTASQRGKQSMPQGAKSKGAASRERRPARRAEQENDMKNQLMMSARGLLTMSIVTCALLVLGACAPKLAEGTYATPEEAVAALVAAMEKDDTAALAKVLGPGSEALVSSGDAVADRNARATFVADIQGEELAASRKAQARRSSLARTTGRCLCRWCSVTGDGPGTVPPARTNSSIAESGRNELGAIDVCRGYVQAQFDYAAEGRDGDPPGIYALKLLERRRPAQRAVLAHRRGRDSEPGGSVRCGSRRRRLSPQRRSPAVPRLLLPHAVRAGRRMPTAASVTTSRTGC